MSTESQGRRSPAGGIFLIVLGSVLGLIALGLLAGGGALLWADQTQRDADGYFTTSTHRFATGSYAITHEGAEIVGIPDSINVGKLARVTIRGSSPTGRPLFLGIGREHDVDTYLAGVPRAELRDFDVDPFRPTYESVGGTARPAAPAEQPFWVATASGEGRITLTWPVHEGTWSVVVMNADGTRGVAANLQLGANIGYLGWIWGGLLGGGIVLLGLGVLLIVLGAGLLRGGSDSPADAAAEPAAVRARPAMLSARLDEPLSRWLWIVKWLLVIPHLIVLAFLWFAFVVLTFAALFAILFTGRYPRGIFDVNVGILRWTWRVGYYAYGGLGTDRYPPFSLGVEPDYPARLDVAYPGELGRGLVLVKWLLAFPHWLVLGVLLGGGTYWLDSFDNWHVASSSGLIGLLVLIAGFALLFTSRYPRGIFDLVVGLSRWVLRVVAYVALMTDEYPPFRLDLGGDEPEPQP